MSSIEGSVNEVKMHLTWRSSFSARTISEARPREGLTCRAERVALPLLGGVPSFPHCSSTVDDVYLSCKHCKKQKIHWKS